MPALLLVDTDVVSYLAKGHPLGDWYRNAVSGSSVAISVVTLGEIEYGMRIRHWSERRVEEMRGFLGRFALIPADESAAVVWATLRSDRKRQGRPIDFADAWIAATALRLNVQLVTHNARDYEGIPGLSLLTSGLDA